MKPTILLADNDETYLWVCKEYLELEGYDVIAATTPGEARVALKNPTIRLAIVDLRLSDDNDNNDISGLRVARDSDSTIPKIVMSLSQTGDVVREAMKVNLGLPEATDFVNKAEGLETLVQTVRRIIQRPQYSKANIEAIHPLQVFLCHSKKDKSRVTAVHDRLKSDGMDPWLDTEKLLPGQQWELEIKKAVRRSDVVIVCLSQSSITQRGYVQKEIKLALDVADEHPEGTTFIIPLKLEECEIPERLRPWQWLNYWEDKAHEKLLLSLKHRASEISGKQSI